MRRPRNQLFLERRSYRRRRLGDAARMLPVFGLILILLPIFWDPATADAPRSTTWDGEFLFVVWAVMIAVAGVLSRGLTGRSEAGEDAQNAAARAMDDDRAGE